MEFHPLLERQLRKYLTSDAVLDESLAPFLKAVNEAYKSYERDKEIAKHAFNVSEIEFNEINSKLQKEIETKKLSIRHLKNAFLSNDNSAENNDQDDDNLLDIVAFVNQQIEKRQLIEEELYWNIKRITTLLRSLHSGVLVESEHRTIAFTNDTFCQLFSIIESPKQLVNIDCKSMFIEMSKLMIDPLGFLKRVDYILLKKKQTVGELVYMKNGQVLERDFIPVIVNNEYRGHLWHYTDVTQRKRAEEELKLSEQKNRLIINSSLDAIIIGDEEMRITSWNPQAEKLLGYNFQEVEGKSLLDLILIPGSHLDKTIRKSKRSKKNQNLFNRLIETEVRRKGNEVFSVELFCVTMSVGNQTLYSVFIRDISERRISENILKANEEKLRSLVANMNLGLIEVDLHETIQYANNSFCEMSGFSAEELLGKNAMQLFVRGENVEKVARSIELRKNSISDAYEIAVKNKRGELKWWYISGAPRYNNKGEVNGSVGIHLDITHQKEIEQELLLAKEEALRSANAKEIFLANMSHEIRTPLNGIIGFLRQISKEELSSEQMMYTESAQKASKHLLSIVNNILDLSKIEARELQLSSHDFSISELLQDVVRILQPQAAENGISLHWYIDKTLPDVLIGDASRLRQILLNLAGNAVKFTERGHVSLAIEALMKKGSIHHFQISVHDTGVGMDQSFANRIFKKFQQEDISSSRKFGGTGLGLVITKELVDLMAGTIEVESEKNKGTSMTVRLALPIGNPKNIVTTSTTENVGNLAQKNILLVEDSSMNRIVAIKALEKYPLKVMEANNGAQALELLRREKFDLILMDLQMPVMGGIEATQIIRNEMRLDIPIVALTANAFKSEVEKCLNAGMNDYLPKPFEEEDLARIISKNLGTETTPKSQTTSDTSQSVAKGQLYNLRRLIEISNNDRDFVHEMLVLFLETTPRSIEEIQQCLSREDVARIRAIAHRMKPSLDNMGISSTLNLVREIEAFDEKKQPYSKLTQMVKTLCTTLEHVLEQIRVNEEI